MAEDKKIVITPEMEARLSKLNWKKLEEQFNIKRESLSEKIQATLAYGDSVVLRATANLADGGKVYGTFKFTPYPGTGEIRAEGVNPKLDLDTISVYGTIINTENYMVGKTRLKDLLEAMTKPAFILDGEGKRITARACVSTPAVSIKGKDGETRQYVLGIDQRSNQVVAKPVDDLYARFLGLEKDGEGNDVAVSRGYKVYGEPLTKEQIMEGIVKGRSFIHEFDRADGSHAKVEMQYNPVSNDFEVVHTPETAQKIEQGVLTGMDWKYASNPERKAERAENKALDVLRKKAETKEQKAAEAPKKKGGKKI